MTRTVVAILLVAAVAVALAIAVSERRVQAAFDAVRQESEGQLERVESLARIQALEPEPGSVGSPAAPARAQAARIELARLRAQARRHSQAAQRDATTTLRLALLLSAALMLLLGLGLSLRLLAQATRLATAAERIARGNLDAAVPLMTGPLALLAPAVRRTASALARREREADALTALAALPPATDLQTAAATDLGPAHEAGAAAAANEAAQLGRLLEAARQTIAGVLDVRALTLVAVDGERVRRLGTSQRDRQAAHYARAGSALAATLLRGDALVFDVDRGVHPEDATARAIGARAYAVVPLDAAAPTAGALIVDLGLCAVAVAELRFLALVAHELAARLGRVTLDRGHGQRVAEVGRAFGSK
jgi:hypothetical protein